MEKSSLHFYFIKLLTNVANGDMMNISRKKG
nr:MAG TPA: hypothetical protein [Bacteriophage sp.]